MGARHVVAKSTPEYRDSCGVSFLLVFPSRHVVNKSVASTEYVMKRFLAPTDWEEASCSQIVYSTRFTSTTFCQKRLRWVDRQFQVISNKPRLFDPSSTLKHFVQFYWIDLLGIHFRLLGALSYRFYRLSLLSVCLIRGFKWRFYHWISIRDSVYFTCCWTFSWWGIQRNGLAQSPLTSICNSKYAL